MGRRDEGVQHVQRETERFEGAAVTCSTCSERETRERRVQRSELHTLAMIVVAASTNGADLKYAVDGAFCFSVAAVRATPLHPTSAPMSNADCIRIRSG